MNYNEAIAVLNDNYSGNKNSLLYSLYEQSDFNAEQFWAVYDSVSFLAREFYGKEKPLDIVVKITFIYQRLLKEIIYHFDENDSSRIRHLPADYTLYLERMEGAADAFLQEIFIDECAYGLQR